MSGVPNTPIIPSRHYAVALILVVVAALALVSAGEARRFKTTLFVEPSPPVVGQPAVFSGCGYEPSEWFKAYIIWPVGRREWTGYDFNSATDARGCLSAAWVPSVAGTTRIYVYQRTPGNSIETVRGMIEFEVDG